MENAEDRAAGPASSGRGVTGTTADARATARARELFLDDANVHGCAETTFVALKEAYDLPDAADSSAAMALNGGIAYQGGPCGAITGAALAVGMVAQRRIPDHQAAKRAARGIVAQLIDDFGAAHGATACRDLIGVDLRSEAGHRAFIESGIWRDRCMRQIEWAVDRLAPLAGDHAWAPFTEPEPAVTAAADGAAGGPVEPRPPGEPGSPDEPRPPDEPVSPDEPRPPDEPVSPDPRTLPA